MKHSAKQPSRGIIDARKRKRECKKLRDENDAIWSRMVKILAGNKSEKEATQEELRTHWSRRLNSHHAFRKEKYPCLRWEVRNGLCIFDWQHVMAKGSAHDDPLVFDKWALPYLHRRGDLEYLESMLPVRVQMTLDYVKERNKALREQYLSLTGHEFTYKKEDFDEFTEHE